MKISYTANNKYQLSPQSWYLYYIAKLRPVVTGSALVFGNAMDKGINQMLNQLLLKDEFNLNNTFLPEIVFSDIMKEQIINGEYVHPGKTNLIKYSKADFDEDILTSEDKKLISEDYNPSWVSLRRKGLLFLEAYREQVLPHLKEVISVQDHVKIENDSGDTVYGYIDFAARFYQDKNCINYNPALDKFNDKIIIFDNKTTSVKYKEDSVRTSGQLGTYFENPNENYQADYAGYIVIPKVIRKKKEPLVPIQIIIDEIPDDIVQKQFAEYENTLDGIKNGRFPCTPEKCCKSFFGCDYQNYCQTGSMEGLVDMSTKKDKEDGR